MDDAYAIAALVRSGVPIEAIASVAGNTSEDLAFANTRKLAGLLRYEGPLLRADEARARLAAFRGRVVALGPLTNVACAAVAQEIILVGGCLETHGRWPPVWPHEFNLTYDRAAAVRVFSTGVPLTIFPLDVARTLWATRNDLAGIGGTLGESLRRESRRWFRHLRLVRLTSRFGIYDLAAALYAIDDAGFTMVETTATMRPNTFIEFGRGARRVRLCASLDRDLLWGRFLQLVNG